MTDTYNPATRPCAHRATPGCTALQQSILGHWKQTTNVGTFVCRPVTGDAGSPSVHGNGRAGDIGITGSVGLEIAEWLVANHTVLGVQLVIWNHRIWTLAKGWHAYGCDKPGSKLDHHTTHIHWEINIDAGSRLTTAIVAPVLPHTPSPHPEPEPEPIPEEINMDFFILNDADDATADQWYWWPELGGDDTGRRAIVPRGSAVTKAQKSSRYCGELEFDRPDLDAIPKLRG